MQILSPTCSAKENNLKKTPELIPISVYERNKLREKDVQVQKSDQIAEIPQANSQSEEKLRGTNNFNSLYSTSTSPSQMNENYGSAKKSTSIDVTALLSQLKPIPISQILSANQVDVQIKEVSSSKDERSTAR